MANRELLLKAVHEAEIVKIYKEGRPDPYLFRLYPFGERGTLLSPKDAASAASSSATSVISSGDSRGPRSPTG